MGRLVAVDSAPADGVTRRSFFARALGGFLAIGPVGKVMAQIAPDLVRRNTLITPAWVTAEIGRAFVTNLRFADSLNQSYSTEYRASA